MTKHRPGQLALGLDAQGLDLPEEVLAEARMLLQQMLRAVVLTEGAGATEVGHD